MSINENDLIVCGMPRFACKFFCIQLPRQFYLYVNIYKWLITRTAWLPCTLDMWHLADICVSHTISHDTYKNIDAWQLDVNIVKLAPGIREIQAFTIKLWILCHPLTLTLKHDQGHLNFNDIEALLVRNFLPKFELLNKVVVGLLHEDLWYAEKHEDSLAGLDCRHAITI